MSTHVCTFEGDNDLYGIGVRIGFYAQLLATQISFTFTSDSTSADSANIWFQLALSITLTYKAVISNPSESIHPIESHIVSLLLSSLLFSGFSKLFIDLAKSWSEAARGKPIRAFISGSMLSIVVKLGLMLWVHAYASWFWWRGIDIMFAHVAPDGSAGCSEVSKWAFFFAKVKIDGWFRTFNKVINTWFLLGWFLGIGMLLAARYLKIANTPFGQLKIFNTGQERRGVLGFFDMLFNDGVGRLNPEFESFLRAQAQFTPDPRHAQWGTFDSGKITHERRVELLRFEGRQRVFSYVFGAGIGFVAILFIILAVECMIVWNGIEGVNDITGTGQLVALVLGAGNLASSFKAVYLDVRRILSDPDDDIKNHIRDVLGLNAVDELIALTASEQLIETGKDI